MTAPRALRRAGVNLLGERAAQKSLHPFMAAELGKQFRLEEALRLGMLVRQLTRSGTRRAANSEIIAALSAGSR